MGKVKHLNDATFDMVVRALEEALATRKPTIKDENIDLALRLLKRPDAD